MSGGHHPLVSILVPVFERARLAEEAIRSALAQSWPSLEVVVVDNASGDDTWAMCQRMAEEDPRVRIFRNETNLGPVRNWRRCLEEARGEYAKLLFSDDLMAPRFIEACMELLQEPGVGFVFAATEIGEEPGRGAQLFYRSLGGTGLYPSSHFVLRSMLAIGDMPVSPGCALFRRRDLLEHLVTEAFDEEIPDVMEHGAGADLLLFLMTAADYPRVGYVDELLVFFRAHPDSISVADHLGEKRLPARYVRTQEWFYDRVWRPRRRKRRVREPQVEIEIALRFAAHHLGAGRIREAREEVVDALWLAGGDEALRKGLLERRFPDGRSVAEVVGKEESGMESVEKELQAIGEMLAGGDANGAFGRISALLQHHAATPGVIALYAEVLLALGEGREAVRVLEEGLSLLPEDPALLNNLAAVRWEQGRRDEALEYAARACRIAPADGSAVLNLGRMLQASERPEEAAELFGNYIESTLDR